MENASDALKMAVAALMFVLAVSVAILAFTKARQAATAILDKSDIEYYNTDNIRISKDRIVGIETVIPTLYSYFNEGYTVLFYDGTVAFDMNTQEFKEGGVIKPLTLYYSEALPSRLALSKLLNKDDTLGVTDFNGKTYTRAIYGFDSNDEDSRQEPWLHDELHAMQFIKSFINNTPNISTYDMSRDKFIGSPNTLTGNKLTMNFSVGDFYSTIGVSSLALATNARFIERTGIYNEIADITKVENTAVVNYSIDSSVIEFSNNGTIENTEGTQKRVIQYIYVGNK